MRRWELWEYRHGFQVYRRRFFTRGGAVAYSAVLRGQPILVDRWTGRRTAL